jgi:glycosyltransferase involved in cell wall biosynthesis
MRIGIDARLADYTIGGIARYTVQLIRALWALAPAHELLAIRSRHPKVAPPAIPAHAEIPVRTPPHHRLERHALSWELRSAGLNVLHTPDFVPPRPRDWARVITVHDLAFLRFPWTVTGASRRYYGGIHRAVREADAVIAVSHATARDLVELVDAAPEKTHVIHEGVEAELAPMDPDEARRAVSARFGIAGRYALFVGTLEPRKNVPTLLHAFDQLRHDFPVRLVLAGARGWLSEDVFRTLHDLALTDGVDFLGPVPPEELRPLYCGAEVLVLPSLYEGFGLPPLEAMACGTPVVVSSAGALPEVVGDAGVVVNPEDPDELAEALGWVLGNPAFQAELARRGLRRAAEFSWERAARETLAIYERVGAQ